MPRIRARLDPAEVIQVKAIWYLADELLVHAAVHEYVAVAAPPAPDDAISSAVDRALPNPAAIRVYGQALGNSLKERLRTCEVKRPVVLDAEPMAVAQTSCYRGAIAIGCEAYRFIRVSSPKTDSHDRPPGA